jgi:hypothetical protein
VTILESKEREKGSNNDSESSSETEMEAGMETEVEAGTETEAEAGTETEAEAGTETEAEAETAFSFVGTVFSVKRTGDSVFPWEGGITFFNGITGANRLCNEGPGQDDEGQGGNAVPRTK